MSESLQVTYKGFRYSTYASERPGRRFGANVIYEPPGHPMGTLPKKHTLSGNFDSEANAHAAANRWMRVFADSRG